LGLNELEVKSLFVNDLAGFFASSGVGGGLTPAHFPKLVFSKSAGKWGWGSFGGRLG
jgi:hypothetical protein